MPKHPHHVTPECCEFVKAYATVFLEMPMEFYDGKLDVPPTWMVRGASKHPGSYCSEPAEFCPHCGAKVPEIERSGRKKVAVITDGGYYCDTCSQRCGECRCLPPAFHWHPKK